MKTIPSFVLILALLGAAAFAAGSATAGAALVSFGIFALAFREYARPARMLDLTPAPVPVAEASRYPLAA